MVGGRNGPLACVVWEYAMQNMDKKTVANTLTTEILLTIVLREHECTLS